MRVLREQALHRRDTRLIGLTNQGKVMECVGADPASSHFLRIGENTRFADWHFVHRACLNLLHLNGAQPWRRESDKRCRRCGFDAETLPHVLDHCSQSRAYTARHNAVVDRVKRAAADKFTVISENKPVGGTRLCPDLLLARGEEALVLDVCIPFENRMRALAEAWTAKELKYRRVAEELRRKFQ